MSKSKAWTLDNIKKFAASHNIKLPKLNKDLCIQYIQGVLLERQRNIFRDYDHKIDMKNVIEVEPEKDWLKQLHHKGWAAVPVEVDDIKVRFDQWLRECDPSYDPTNPKTWDNVPCDSRGVLNYYIQHSDWMWSLRVRCKSIFDKIWNRDDTKPPIDLLTSLDGASFIKGKDETVFPGWIHTDQPNNITNMSCVQGIVTFTPSSIEDGGLILCEDSHKIFAQYMIDHPAEGITWMKSDLKDPNLSKCRLIRPKVPKNHIILFDSRMFHCNTPPTRSDRYRQAAYVSMQPRSGADQSILEKRQKAYTTCRGTGHWCYGRYFKLKDAKPFRGKEKGAAKITLPVLTWEQRQLL